MNHNKLKELRIVKGLTQTEVARACGVSLNTYVKWETGGTKEIRPEMVERLKEVLK